MTLTFNAKILFTAVLDKNSHLNERPARRQWEVAFNNAYVRSVTETFDRNVHSAFQSVMNDNDQGNKYLFSHQVLIFVLF